jgi:endonuclease YncB( thermonuclease family)
MNWRFRRRVKIVPGCWLNLSKSGVSLSAGVTGATVNVGKRGVRGTASLHGTGLSVSETIPWPKCPHGLSPRQKQAWCAKQLAVFGERKKACRELKRLSVVGKTLCDQIKLIDPESPEYSAKTDELGLVLDQSLAVAIATGDADCIANANNTIRIAREALPGLVLSGDNDEELSKLFGVEIAAPQPVKLFNLNNLDPAKFTKIVNIDPARETRWLVRTIAVIACAGALLLGVLTVCSRQTQATSHSAVPEAAPERSEALGKVETAASAPNASTAPFVEAPKLNNLFSLPIASAERAQVVTGKVVAVTDGDTIKVLSAGNQLTRIRLAFIDAPEKAQAFGQRAKQAMSSLVFGKTVELKTHAIDRYGRTVSQIFVDGQDEGLQLIKLGFAWVYPQYIREAPSDVQGAYWAAQWAARGNKLGLWQDAKPQEPWLFRHAKREPAQ